MGKTSTTITYITVAVIVLFLVSHSPKNPGGHRHRRLKLRTAFEFDPNPNRHSHEPVPFDPVVSEIERRREDKEWERQYFQHTHSEVVDHHHSAAPGHESQPEWEDFMDAEDFLNDEDKFNVTNRLVMLFPKIDIEPADGVITEKELTDWNLQQAQREVLHRTQRDMDIHDKNKDGFISFSEYEPPTWARKADNGSFGYDMGWWKKEHFNASDADGDGFLNLTEFNDFLHPADSINPKLFQWLCKEEVRERDSDRDGKINFNEFIRGVFDLIRNYEEENHGQHSHEGSSEASAHELFNKIDKDGDGYLSDIELLSVITLIHPSEKYYAKQQANYIINQVDTNKDGSLTLAEMIDNPYVFYSAIFSNNEDGYDSHDEFR